MQHQYLREVGYAGTPPVLTPALRLREDRNPNAQMPILGATAVDHDDAITSSSPRYSPLSSAHEPAGYDSSRSLGDPTHTSDRPAIQLVGLRLTMSSAFETGVHAMSLPSRGNICFPLAVLSCISGLSMATPPEVVESLRCRAKELQRQVHANCGRPCPRIIRQAFSENWVWPVPS